MYRLAALALTTALAVGPAAAQTTAPAIQPQPPAIAPAPSEAPADVRMVDARTFVSEAMALHNVLVGTSRIAMLKPVDTGMKAYAEKMIIDHTEAARRLAETAQAAGIDAEAGPEVGNQAYVEVYDRLSGAQGQEFAELFVRAHKAAIGDALKLFTGYSETGEEESLRVLATATIPTLLEHQADIVIATD